MSTTNSAGRAFRPDIEGLRAIAVLLVIAFHSGASLFRGGFIGVDVFFVLSGYLITGLLVEELGRSDKLNLVQFYSRRVRRLLPAGALVVAVTVLVSSVVLPPLDQASLGQTALSTFLYSSNLYFAHARNDYFAPSSANNPLLHTWSLAVEEQFYFVWPLLLLVAWKLFRSRKSLAWAVAVTTALSLFGCIWLTATNQALAFFLSPARAWEFGIGALLSFLPAFSSRRWAFVGRVLGWTGLAIVLFCSVSFTSAMRFPGYVAVLPAIGTGAALVAGKLDSQGGLAALLGIRPLTFLGNVSYSLYLWHWPVLVLTAAAVPVFSPTVRVLCVLASIGLAALTYFMFENPIRFNRFLVSRPMANIAAAIVISIVGASTSQVWRHKVTHSASYLPYATAMDDIPRLYKQACRADFRESQPRECTFGSSTSSVNVVLFGDSHAAQWFPALEQMAQQHGWKLSTLVKSSCPAVDIASWNTFLQRQESECDQWRQRAVRRIIAMHPAAVIVSTFSTYYEPAQPAQQVSYSEWLSGARRTFQTLSDANVQTIFIRDTPFPGFDVPRCLSAVAWTRRGACDAPNRSDALNPKVFEAQQLAAKPFADVATIDLSDEICSGPTCELKRGDMILYRDQNHLTGAFIRHLAPVLDRKISPLIRSRIASARLQMPVLQTGIFR